MFRKLLPHISIVLRNVIGQLETPDRLRGRITGVEGPQLGELETGEVAQWFGAVFSVVSGGLGYFITTALIALTTPDLRSCRRKVTPSRPEAGRRQKSAKKPSPVSCISWFDEAIWQIAPRKLGVAGSS